MSIARSPVPHSEVSFPSALDKLKNTNVRPLCSVDPSTTPREVFIRGVSHNYGELYVYHRHLLDQFFGIQIVEHLAITAPTYYDAVLDFSLQPKDFVERCMRHLDAHRPDANSCICRHILRLLRYELLLQGILKEILTNHGNLETVPTVSDVIKGLGKETEHGIASSKQKVKLWRCNASLIFGVGEYVDTDFLEENRSLIHTGGFLRQPETGFEWNGWKKLFAFLFDDCLVLTEPMEKGGVTQYQVYRRPIPLDLLTLAAFTDPPTQPGDKLLPLGGGKETDGQNQNVGSPSARASTHTANDALVVYPCTFHHNGRLGGLYTLFSESAQERFEWKAKLEEAIRSRKVSQGSNKVFKVETLSVNTSCAPTLPVNSGLSWNNDEHFVGKITCSVPFRTTDGRSLVAIGSAEGVWVWFRHDSRSMRRVLHLRMVTQCAVLEDFGIFLVLADKSLFAYHIEKLTPSPPRVTSTPQTPRKLSGNEDVLFFAIGNLSGRTLVIYMKKEELGSVFRVLEPIIGKIQEKTTQPWIGPRFGPRSQRTEWFRVYRDFFLPSNSSDLLFLRTRIVILCSKGLEIVDLSDFKSVTIPRTDDPRLEKLAERTKSCRPMGMFRSKKDEFLLCYDEFGLYVDEHGDPTRSMGTVEWEGRAKQVAWHPPYILLFDSRFIEIRHVETGRLVQIVPGNDIRCIWDGRSVNQSQAISGGSVDGVVPQDSRVYVVMNVESPGRRGVTIQHVLEFIPTVPLCLRGSPASPLHVSYSNQSIPPPHSPSLEPHYPASGGFMRAGMVTGGKIAHPTRITASQLTTPIRPYTQEKRNGAGKSPLIAHTVSTSSGISAGSEAPAWKRLISHSLLPHEVISLIDAAFTSKEEVKVINGLRGDDAQTFINTIHEAMDLPGFSPRLRGKCLTALSRICGRQALLPRSLQIPICYTRWDNPLYQGGFADIWMGKHQGRRVAVKVLRIYSTSDIGRITRKFCKEVVTWNALCHPHVLPLLGVTMDEKKFAMISEWMVNGNINEYIKSHWEANPFELFKEVTSGLMYIHSQGMVHGDLKGANILIDQDRHVRLADFGLLTIVSDHTNFTTSNSTSTGGTIRWMSPELLHPALFGVDHGRPTKESDCYALGMVIYEVLTGKPPFTPLKDYIVMRMVTDGERPGRPEGKRGAWFTDDLWKMLGLCWATNVQSRPSIETVCGCLEQVSSIWRPLPPQVDELAEKEDDLDLTVLTNLALESRGPERPSLQNQELFSRDEEVGKE